MKISVYKPKKKDNVFLYLQSNQKLDCLSDDMRATLGEVYKVLDFELETVKNLMQVDKETLKRELLNKKYFLYIQSNDPIEKIIQNNL